MEVNLLAPHNLWLRCSARGEVGQYLRCTLLYGHHFKVEGQADPSNTRLSLEIPAGECRRLELEPQADGLVAGFSCERPGVYSLLAEYDLGVYSHLKDGSYLRGRVSREDVTRIVHFRHFAKTIVTIGDQGNWPGSYGMPLEIIPLRLDRDEVDILVQAGGRPLVNNQVFAHCNGRAVSRFTRTGPDGKVSLGVFQGEWMFIVRLETEGEKDIDARIQGATLTLNVNT